MAERSPIDLLLDGVDFRCTLCNAPMGTCGCWIALECPQCGRRKTLERDPSDPPGTAKVVAHCDRCPGEDNGTVSYYDRSGKQILFGEGHRG